MKNFLAAFTAVFFMLTVMGCSDNTESDTATEDVAVEASEDTSVSEDGNEGEAADVNDDDTSSSDDSTDSNTEEE